MFSMPATPRARLRNPIRTLRVILGEFGSPMSQEDFASKTGVSVNTLRSTENGRLPLSDEMLRRIKAHWYAHWNPHREGWYFAYIGDLPFTKELYDKVVEPISEPNEDELMKNKLRQRFDDVLEATPSEALRGQIMRLSEDLANRAEYSGLDVDLSSTEPLWYLRRAANGKVRLIAKYRSGKTGPIPDRTRNASRKKRPKGH
jgi:transcriptional regulator with XRE-family HTH domain